MDSSARAPGPAVVGQLVREAAADLPGGHQLLLVQPAPVPAVEREAGRVARAPRSSARGPRPSRPAGWPARARSAGQWALLVLRDRGLRGCCWVVPGRGRWTQAVREALDLGRAASAAHSPAAACSRPPRTAPHQLPPRRSSPGATPATTATTASPAPVTATRRPSTPNAASPAPSHISDGALHTLASPRKCTPTTKVIQGRTASGSVERPAQHRGAREEGDHLGGDDDPVPAAEPDGIACRGGCGAGRDRNMKTSSPTRAATPTTCRSGPTGEPSAPALTTT